MTKNKEKNYCPRCGKEISVDERYCSNCGENLEKSPNQRVRALWLVFPVFMGVIGAAIIHILFHKKNMEIVKASWVIALIQMFFIGAFII